MPGVRPRSEAKDATSFKPSTAHLHSSADDAIGRVLPTVVGTMQNTRPPSASVILTQSFIYAIVLARTDLSGWIRSRPSNIIVTPPQHSISYLSISARTSSVL